MSTFGNTVLVGNPTLRNETHKSLRNLQMIYRHEQVRQLEEELKRLGLNPQELEFHGVEHEKNACPSTGFESESGVLFNKRTGVSIGVILDWACEWNCGPEQWRGESPIGLHTCQPSYFFIGLSEENIQALK
jgi:hypothetical protein